MKLSTDLVQISFILKPSAAREMLMECRGKRFSLTKSDACSDLSVEAAMFYARRLNERRGPLGSIIHQGTFCAELQVSSVRWAVAIHRLKNSCPSERGQMSVS